MVSELRYLRKEGRVKCMQKPCGGGSHKTKSSSSYPIPHSAPRPDPASLSK